MKKVFIAVLFCLAVSSVQAQYPFFEKEDSVFIKGAIRDKRNVILIDSINDYYIAQMKKELSRDTFHTRMTYPEGTKVHEFILSAKEREYVDRCIGGLHSFRWTNSAKNKLGLTNFIVPPPVNVSPRAGGISNAVYSIIPPIFLRDNTICIFFYSYSCGPLCGHGDMSIYAKENNIWKRIWMLSVWDN